MVRTRTTVIRVAAGVLAAAVLLWAVDVAGNLNVLGTLTATVVDFTSATSTAPMKSGTTLPATCSVGQQFFKSDAVAGQNIYLCTAANTWTQVTGGGGTFDWKPSAQYAVYQSEMNAFYNQGSPAYLGGLILSRAVGSTTLNNPNYDPPYPNAGIASIATTAVAANRIAWNASVGGPFASETSSYFTNTNRPWELVVVFRYRASTDYAASDFYVGLLANTSENPPRGVCVRYLSGSDTSFTIAYGQQNAWGGTIVTGVAPDTNWHKLRIRADGTTANKIWIKLDNGTEYSGCPTGCDLAVATYQNQGWCGTLYLSLTTNEAVAKTVQFDYVHFWADLGTQR